MPSPRLFFLPGLFIMHAISITLSSNDPYIGTIHWKSCCLLDDQIHENLIGMASWFAEWLAELIFLRKLASRVRLHDHSYANTSSVHMGFWARGLCALARDMICMQSSCVLSRNCSESFESLHALCICMFMCACVSPCEPVSVLRCGFFILCVGWMLCVLDGEICAWCAPKHHTKHTCMHGYI